MSRTPGNYRPPLSKQRDASPERAPDKDTYEVDSIMDAKKTGRSWKYLIKWVGYPERKDWTWEAEENIHNKALPYEYHLQKEKATNPKGRFPLHPMHQPGMPSWKSALPTAFQEWGGAKYTKRLTKDSDYNTDKPHEVARRGWKPEGVVAKLPTFKCLDQDGNKATPGCTLPFSKDTTPLQWMSAFWTTEMIDLCLREGNRYASQKIEAKKEKDKDLDDVDRAWKAAPFTRFSIATWVAIRFVVHAIHNISYNVKDCWSTTDELTAIPYVAKRMSQSLYLAHNRSPSSPLQWICMQHMKYMHHWNLHLYSLNTPAYL